MDADGSHQPEQLHRLLDALADADLVIGSRWVPGGSVVNWSWFRRALSVGGNRYARLLLGVPVRDLTAGYRLFHAATLRAIDLDGVESVGYCFQADLALRTVRAGLRVREVPIDFLERERGESKMDRSVAVESLRRITRVGTRPADAARPQPPPAAPCRPARTRGGTTVRRRGPWAVLAVLFVVVPLAEIFLIVQLGQVVGPWWTILLLIATGILGSVLVKREGGRAWRALQEALASHRMPATELADGALILIGGTLLITPGFMSDLVGLFCILPFTRPVARRALAQVVRRRFVVTARRPGHTEVIRGEVVDDE